VSVAGDGACPTTTWTKDPLSPTGVTAPTRGVAPAGANAGRDYLNDEHQHAPLTERGCVDIVRSDADPRAIGTTSGTDASSFEYYAFGLDAVAWASSSLKAPATLTLAQIRGIYNCTITDWGAVNGIPGPIVPYLPSTGSGTYAAFVSTFLGGVAPSTSCVPTAHRIVEDTGVPIAVNDTDKAIVPYSTAAWDFQQSNQSNKTLDLRNGLRLGGYTTGAATPVKAVTAQWVGGDAQYELATPSLIGFLGLPASYAVVSEANEPASSVSFDPNRDYVGVHYISNVIDAGGSTPGYEAARTIVGFDATTNVTSALCSGNYSSSLLARGYAPLDTTNPRGTNPLASTCRVLRP
jgi:phosphate transport system substrate-binding protein